MSSPELRPAALALALALLAPGPVRAEVALSPPRGAEAARYEAAARGVGAETRAQYFGAGAAAQPRLGAVKPSEMSAVLAVLAVLAGGFLLLRFGGTGTLLARDPARPGARPAEAPVAWGIAAEAAAAPDLFARIAAMEDRRAALVLLLRHALLAAAGRGGVRLARSDTEREAFARIPAALPGRPALADLLREAELANYGGRLVAEEVFARCLAAARGLLGGGAHA